jgi:hypothetical protein
MSQIQIQIPICQWLDTIKSRYWSLGFSHTHYPYEYLRKTGPTNLEIHEVSHQEHFIIDGTSLTSEPMSNIGFETKWVDFTTRNIISWARPDLCNPLLRDPHLSSHDQGLKNQSKTYRFSGKQKKMVRPNLTSLPKTSWHKFKILKKL